MLWYSTPWTAPPFCNDPLWLTLFVEGVNDCLLDHCQVSSVPLYCGFKEQEIARMYTVWMVIYWNSNVNILIFWDTDFWLSLANKLKSSKLKQKQLLKCFTLLVMNQKYMKESFTFWNKLQEKINFFTKFKFFEMCLYTHVTQLVLWSGVIFNCISPLRFQFFFFFTTYWFKMTWGWVYNDWISICRWSNTLNKKFLFNKVSGL